MHPKIPAGIVKGTIVVAGRKTGISLEEAFWNGLREIANARGLRPRDLVTRINADRRDGNLSSAVRVFVLQFYQEEADRAILARGSEAHV